MPSGGCCITLWDVVDYWYVNSQLCGDNTATGFWLSVGGIGGTACASVGKVRTVTLRPREHRQACDGLSKV